MQITAFAAAALLAAALLVAGHYALRPPRLELRAPATYLYGVTSCLVGLALYCLLVRSWDVPLLVVAGVFVVAGAVDFACYRWDGDTEAVLTDKAQKREIAALREELGRRT
jgi:hypothetical protein